MLGIILQQLQQTEVLLSETEQIDDIRPMPVLAYNVGKLTGSQSDKAYVSHVADLVMDCLIVMLHDTGDPVEVCRILLATTRAVRDWTINERSRVSKGQAQADTTVTNQIPGFTGMTGSL